MDASCGPSNALTNLSKYSQQDKSLQHQNVVPGTGVSQFRNVGVDQNLNREFSGFSDGQFGGQFAPQAPQTPMHQQPMHQMRQTGASQQQAPQNMQQNMNQKWVLDFSNMSLQNNGWHHQFMQKGPSHMQSQHQQHSAPFGHQMGQVRPATHTMGMAQMNQLNLMHMQQNMPIPATGNGSLTEHQEVHKFEQHKQQFEDQFAQVEQEMQVNESEKEEFARTAQKIHDTMLSSTKEEATSEKFQNSNFLKLMSSISNRSVELNDQGDKLIHKQSGQDIREREREEIKQYLPDPLRDLRNEAPTYHEPPLEHDASLGARPQIFTPSQQAEAPRPDQQRHLPDPLAHIPDGALSGIELPLQAAKIISGNQVETGSWMEDVDSWQTNPSSGQRRGIMANQEWQEVYDDYRHDDDYR